MVKNYEPFLQRGWAVFPLSHNSKEPVKGSSGFKGATKDPVIAQHLFASYSGNFGIATGRASSVVVIDCDNKEGKPGVAIMQSLMDQHGCPQTYTVGTPNDGCHLYFKYPSGEDIPSGTSVVAEGIDVRANGGYVVGPGSTLNTKTYSVDLDVPLAEMPAWLIERCRKQTKKTKTTTGPEAAPIDARVIEARLKVIPNTDYDDWLRVGMALHSWDSSRGLALWDAWSKSASNYEPDACAGKWGSFAGSDITVGTLIHMSNEHGYAPPVPERTLKSIYFDMERGQYWVGGSNLGWQLLGVDAVRRRLAIRGLHPDRAPGERVSEVDSALAKIEEKNSVDGAFPGFYRKEEIIEHHQYRLLNTSRVRCLTPDAAANPDGQGFPWVKEYLTKLTGAEAPEEERAYAGSQFAVLTAWMAHFYRSALAGYPTRGLALFLAGPPGSGKTFLTNAILKNVFGAVGEATKFLLREDQFNASIFSCPIWNVDDAAAGIDAKSHARFSSAVKACVANDEFTMRAMRREGVRMKWSGRLITTMNDDPDSIMMLPHGEGSMRDKYILLKTYATFDEFPNDELVKAELPFFCSWLRDMPDDTTNVLVGGRFGVKPFHHPVLVEIARESSSTFSVYELVQTWAANWFVLHNDQEQWTGNPTVLVSELAVDPFTKDIARSLRLSPASLGRALSKLISTQAKGISRAGGRSKGRVYFITKDILAG